MLHTMRFRACALLLLLGLLALPAFGQDTERAETVWERGVVSWFWHALGDLIPALGKSRGSMDPNGQPLPPNPPSSTDSRGTMDPDGNA
jgi:hypothetical protein